MNITRLTEPAIEPITLDEARQHLNIIGSDRDDWVQRAISEARDYCEQYCNRIWAAAEFIVSCDSFSDPMPLPPGTNAVVSITYIDSDGIEQTLSDDAYTVSARLTSIRPVDAWPSGTDVQVICNIGPDAGASPPQTIPPSVRAALKLVLGDLFENREAAMVAVTRTDNPAVERLLHFYREGLGV